MLFYCNILLKFVIFQQTLFSNVYILGGVRVPAFINSKLLTNTGTTSMDLMHVTDWLPTIVNLAGGFLFSCFLQPIFVTNKETGSNENITK